MKNPSSEKPTARSGQRPATPASPESIEKLPLRTRKPGENAPADEARAGLGTRAADPSTGKSKFAAKTPVASATVPQPPEEHGEPQEQDPDSLAQQQQRETGVSGHMGGT